MEAYLSSGLGRIIIDRSAYEISPNRCRFTYAHELGHIILHGDFYRTQKIKDITGYQRFQSSLSNDEERRIESQAHAFAGYVLLPQQLFREKVDALIRSAGGESQLNIQEFSLGSRELVKLFQVSEEVFMLQLKRSIRIY